MSIRANEKYPIYRSVVDRLGDMMYNVTGDLRTKHEMEDCLMDIIETAYQDGVQVGKFQGVSHQEIIDQHFQNLINKFK